MAVHRSLLFACIVCAAGAAYAAERNIVQAGQAFSETDIAVTAGTRVNFLNQDDVKHNILVQQGDDEDGARDMGIQVPGKTIVVLFDKAGKFTIRCHIHQAMRLNVTVN